MTDVGRIEFCGKAEGQAFSVQTARDPDVRVVLELIREMSALIAKMSEDLAMLAEVRRSTSPKEG